MAKTRNTPLETVEQQAFIAWVRNFHPGLPVFAIPNGGVRDVRTAARLKLEGVSAGVPDLFIPEPVGNKHGMFIELKRQAGGRETGEQRAWRRALLARGYECQVCQGRYEAYAALCEYLGVSNRFKELHSEKMTMLI